MKKEHELILLTVLVNKTSEEREKINELINSKLDWCEIAGQVINHRLGGYFYNGLTEEQRGRMPNEFRSVLKILVSVFEKTMKERLQEFTIVSKTLDDNGVRYAALKGLIFVTDFYGLGDRRSNDIDIMVLEDDLIKLDTALRSLGYIQSYLPNGQLIEASRKEKIIQRMNYHDLVPYVKKIDSGLVTIDVNFKFDTKDHDIDYEIYDYGLRTYSNNGYSVKGLPFYTHLLFLCIHFYREGTNTLWTSSKRDIVLYKIVDIMNYIRAHSNEFKIEDWCKLVKKFELEKKCYYTFAVLSRFYPDETFEHVKRLLEPKDLSFMNEITVEGENRIIYRNSDFVEEAFNWIWEDAHE